MLDLIKQQLDAYANGNWEEYRTTLADDAVYDEVATGQRVEGAEGFLAAVKRWKAAFPDLRAKIISSVVSGDEAFVEVEWTGTHTGTLDAPFGSIPATNRKLVTRAALALRFEDRKLLEGRHYFDVFTMMTQLGLAPNLAAQTAEPAGAQPQQRT